MATEAEITSDINSVRNATVPKSITKTFLADLLDKIKTFTVDGLAGKQATESGKGLSENNFTTVLKNKLDNIAVVKAPVTWTGSTLYAYGDTAFQATPAGYGSGIRTFQWNNPASTTPAVRVAPLSSSNVLQSSWVEVTSALGNDMLYTTLGQNTNNPVNQKVVTDAVTNTRNISLAWETDGTAKRLSFINSRVIFSGFTQLRGTANNLTFQLITKAGTVLGSYTSAGAVNIAIANSSLLTLTHVGEGYEVAITYTGSTFPATALTQVITA